MLAARLIGKYKAALSPALATEAAEDGGETCGDVSRSGCADGGATAAAAPTPRGWGVGPR